MEQLNDITPTLQEQVETLNEVVKELMETLDYCKDRIQALTTAALLESQAREDIEKQLRNLIQSPKTQKNDFQTDRTQGRAWKSDTIRRTRTQRQQGTH